MSKRLEGKVAVITGAASGIGEASARRFVEEGCKVVLGDIQPDLGQALAEELGADVIFVECNVTVEKDISHLVDVAVNKFGKLDVMFNNAGIVGPTAKLLEIKPEEWAQVLAVNLTSVFSCLQAEIAQMIQQESGGSIVNTASICGLVALPHASAYNAAKHGIVGLTKSSALEYGPQNIRVNAVCPGFIDTPMLAKGAGANAKVLEKVVRTIPMRRVAGANEVADVVAWLLSAQSSYVSGVAMPIDGGWVVQ